MKTHQNPTILIAVLNWGLGHATRCMPIIDFFIQENYQVILASDGLALDLLKKEYPTLKSFCLPAYDIKYFSSNFALNIVFQLHKIIWAIRAEHKLLQHIVKEQDIDLVISDNRYGCYSKSTKSIFITHQINIISPYAIFTPFVRWFNHKFIKRFYECWVPDSGVANANLSGILSHAESFSFTTRYLGIISRMRQEKRIADCDSRGQYDLAVVLSGPEPQRTTFEQEILKQLLQLKDKKIILIRGLVNERKHYFIENIEIFNFLQSEELNEVLLSAKAVVCRSGYSSIMDLCKMKKSALLIPTPGQTEQEYLAKYMQDLGFFPYQHQHELNVNLIFDKEFKRYAPQNVELFDATNFKEIVRNVINYNDFHS
ncbi:MAG: hypothetical protein KA010_01675 [Saprospiraceae bacterium]|nr:hypothetical protein [Saprospiraceae bacterium]